MANNNLRQRLRDAKAKFGRIPADQANAYDNMMSGVAAFSEKAAPEAFRWLGWVVALSAVDVVRHLTGQSWLLGVTVVFTFLMAMRVQWAINMFNRSNEVRLPDGSIQINFRRRIVVASFVMGLACWAITLALVVGLGGAIVQSELVERAFGSAPSGASG